jgi:hypothetical protein
LLELVGFMAKFMSADCDQNTVLYTEQAVGNKRMNIIIVYVRLHGRCSCKAISKFVFVRYPEFRNSAKQIIICNLKERKNKNCLGICY